MSANDRQDLDTRLELIGLLVILALTLVMRIQHLDTLLPWFFHDDELRTTSVTLRLLKFHTLDPAHTYYPALAFYTNAVFFYLWGAVGEIGLILKRGPLVVLDLFWGYRDIDPPMIMLTRWVSMVFGMGSIILSHLLARMFLDRRWALFCTLLVALNSTLGCMMVLGKVDTIHLFWMMAGFYTSLKYFREMETKWLILASICAGFSVVTKNYPQIAAGLPFLILHRFWRQRPGQPIWKIIYFPDLWIGALLIPLSAFIGSPYSFIRFKLTLINAGWLYKNAEIISFYHTDPAVWWLDRYFYMGSIVLPFVLGLPMFWAMVGGAINHARKYAFSDPYILYNLVWFLYILSSGSGGKSGGAFPYYLTLNVMPLAVLMAADGTRDLVRAKRTWLRVAGFALAALLLTTSLLRADAFRTMFFENYDRVGPWLNKNVSPTQRTLMISVHKPSPALGIVDFKSVWPHEFTEELLRSYDPDVIVIDTWTIGGFRKIYRDLWVAPLVDSLLSGERGYHVVKTWRANYFNWRYYAWLDVEHDVEMIVLEKTTGPEGGT